jgi:hypothetical protein
MASGSMVSPWDLQTALSQPPSFLAGDTLYLRGGIYAGNFTSTITGAPGNYAVVMAYPGERATLADNRQYASGATLQVNGAWTIYQDIEITNTIATRTSTSSASFRPMGVQAQGPHCKFIHLVIHDTGHGIGFWKEAEDAEIYGCLIYNCGTANSIGNYITHGHGIYTQNDNGLKKISHNVVFNQFGFGLHLYPNPGHLRGYEIEGNVLFHNGILTDTSFRLNNILAETYSPYQATNITITGNFTFDDKTSYPHTSIYDFDVLAGTPASVYGSVRIDSNYFAGNGRAGLAVINWDSAQVQHNQTFYRDGTAAAVFPVNSTYSWNNNTYYGLAPAAQFAYQSNQPAPFATWVQQSGFDANSTYTNSMPAGTPVFGLPDQYTPGRSLLVVYNWAQQAGVSIAPPGLTNGDAFEIIDVQNYYGPPVYTGIYNPSTPVVLSLSQTQTAAPLGWSAVAHTSSYFNCFIVRKTIATGVNEAAAIPSFSLYPVPASNELWVTLNQQPEALLKLTDEAGRVVLTQQISAGQNSCVLSLSGLASGIYVLELQTANGIGRKRFIVQ